MESKHLSAAISECGRPRFWPRLHGLLCDVVAHEMMGVFLYQGNNPPSRLYDSYGGAMRDDVHQILSEAGYLISPYYHKLIRPQASAAFYHLSEVAPDDFHESEYYHAYYAKKGVEDEGMYHVPVHGVGTLVVMVERTSRMARFTAAENAALKAFSPIVIALISSHFRFDPLGGRVMPTSETGSMIGFRNVAERFGADILSNREREVAMLILRGHSTKSAARELSIAPETERVHRRRLYTKLGISSHSELFWLFFESTDYFDPIKRNDPLATYLQQRSFHPTGA